MADLVYYDPLSVDEVAERISALAQLNNQSAIPRQKLRDIAHGGRAAVLSLFGATTKLRDEDLPVVNLLASGMDRLAQVLGDAPDVKVDPPPGLDSPTQRSDASLRESIVESYDVRSKLETKLPYLARWTPLYGYSLILIRPKMDRISRAWFPHLELRDSFDVYPGWWGADQEPEEVMVRRNVDARWLARTYPAFGESWSTRSHFQARTAWWPGAWSPGWEGPAGENTILTEYHCTSGTYLMAEDTGQLLDWIPNYTACKHFVLIRRPTFSALQGQWDHAIGLMSMMAKLNVLGFIAAEDAVFKELNIVGDPTNAAYRRGRNQVNYFPPGTQIIRGAQDPNLSQTFAQIDRVERQLRIQANYSLVEDSQSPTSFVTGQGLDRLSIPGDRNVREYQKYFRYGLQEIDAIRLEFDETFYGGNRKSLEANSRGEAAAANYDPKKIAGQYTTRRVYGVMAGWDEPQKIVTGLQLVQGRIISRRDMQENLSGLEKGETVDDRIWGDAAMDSAIALLNAQAQQGDPAARLILMEIALKPKERYKTLERFFTPEEPQPSPEEMAMAGGPGAPPPGPPEDVATVLSRLEATGEIGTGSQIVGRMQPAPTVR